MAFLMLCACTPVTVEISAQEAVLSTTPVPTEFVISTFTPVPSPTSTVTVTAAPEPSFSFVVTSDMSYTGGTEYIDYPNFFVALLAYIQVVDTGSFMVSTGDVLPAEETRWTIDQVLGKEYLWFPLPGNHDFGTADIRYLQTYDYDPNGAAEPNIVNWGPDSCPRTTYSFEYMNVHFVMLNVYCDEESPWGIDGSITDTIYDWLAADLASTEKTHLFVFGHEPAFPQPDDQTGNVAHLHESLDQYPEARDRFWQLLQEYEVVAYIHGHTHNYSAVNMGGVWQIDAGHAMGVRAAPSPGTFLIVTVQGERIILQTYRGEESPGFSYDLFEELQLSP